MGAWNTSLLPFCNEQSRGWGWLSGGVRTDIQASRVLMPMATLHDLILNRNKRHPNLGRELSLLGRKWKKSTKGFTSLQFELFKAPGVSFCTHSTYNNDIFKLPQLIPMIAVLPISTATWNKQLKQLPPQAIGKRVEKSMTARKPWKVHSSPWMKAVKGWRVLDSKEEEAGCTS